MKKLLVISLCIFSVSFIFGQKSKQKKSIFEKDLFKKLDSIVQANPTDTIFYCSPYLIRNVEKITKLDATEAGASFVGKIFFTMGNYRRWDEWREKNLKP
jgi:hypothetical protein